MERLIEKIELEDHEREIKAVVSLSSLRPETRKKILDCIIEDMKTCGYTRRIIVTLEPTD